MNRSTRALFFVPIAALATGAALSVACRGGGTLDGLDAGWNDGEAVRITARGVLCEKAMVTIDDTAADEAATDGPGCAKDDECTVRLEGDYCGCPSHPRPLLVQRAAELDDSLVGITKRCNCAITPCEPVRPSRAVCRERRCVLADGDADE